MSAKWFLYTAGEETGPFGLPELCQRILSQELPGDVLVRRCGAELPTRADRVIEFRRYLSQSAAASEQPTEDASEDRTETTRPFAREVTSEPDGGNSELEPADRKFWVSATLALLMLLAFDTVWLANPWLKPFPEAGSTSIGGTPRHQLTEHPGILAASREVSDTNSSSNAPASQ